MFSTAIHMARIFNPAWVATVPAERPDAICAEMDLAQFTPPSAND